MAARSAPNMENLSTSFRIGPFELKISAKNTRPTSKIFVPKIFENASRYSFILTDATVVLISGRDVASAIKTAPITLELKPVFVEMASPVLTAVYPASRIASALKPGYNRAWFLVSLQKTRVVLPLPSCLPLLHHPSLSPFRGPRLPLLCQYYPSPLDRISTNGWIENN